LGGGGFFRFVFFPGPKGPGRGAPKKKRGRAGGGAAWGGVWSPRGGTIFVWVWSPLGAFLFPRFGGASRGWLCLLHLTGNDFFPGKRCFCWIFWGGGGAEAPLHPAVLASNFSRFFPKGVVPWVGVSTLGAPGRGGGGGGGLVPGGGGWGKRPGGSGFSIGPWCGTGGGGGFQPHRWL